jgi:hypothetical protein
MLTAGLHCSYLVYKLYLAYCEGNWMRFGDVHWIGRCVVAIDGDGLLFNTRHGLLALVMQGKANSIALRDGKACPVGII